MTQPRLAYAQTVLPIHRHVNRPRDDQTPLPLTLEEVESLRP